ncbi:MAG: NADPH-dependent 2,4-dienoyl-CoA reductase [Dermatophilaceae bacterium]
MAFDHLLQPLRIGSVTVRNRLVMGAMHTRLETLDRPVERLVEFYRVRAAAEVGLILTGGFAPSPEGRMDPETAVLASVEDLERHGHRRICDAVHAEGGSIVLQILHAGRYAKVPECVGPSPRRARINAYAPRALATDEVWHLVEQFATTARLAVEGGYDGVEVMGSEGYLLNEFTSPRTNERTDEFGGDLEGRLRLPVEIVRSVRTALGPERVLVYRISAIDLVPDGLTGGEVLELARRVEAAGADIVNTGIGWHESAVPTIAASVPRAAWRFAVRRVKAAVGIPVVASNRFTTPADADAVLASGDADLVSMARPFLADAELARKTREGRVEQICPCIGCNQACLDAIFTDRAATCLVNPIAGRELDFRSPPPGPAGRRRVAVVGAGPAGLAYAVTAASRGHRVALYDSADSIGGQLDLARRVPGKAEFAELLRYYRGQLDRLGVTVTLGQRVDAAHVVAGGWDTVVVATGVTPRVPDIEGIEHPSVVSSLDVLSGRVEVGPRVAVIGAGGVGFDVAEFLLGDPAECLDAPLFLARWGVDETIGRPGGLLAEGRHSGRPVRPSPRPGDPASAREVTLLQRTPGRLGRTLGKSTGWILRARLAEAGLRELSGVTYERIDDAGLHYLLEGQTHVLPVDTVVVCAGQDSDRLLHEQLIAAGLEPVLVGGAHRAAGLDAAAAIDEATRAAYRL